MSVKFLNTGVTVNTIRPTGWKFPVGLTNYGGDAYDGPSTVDYLVVAGGGGSGGGGAGSGYYSGGGGAGGFQTGSGFSITRGTSYSVTEIGRAHV